MQGTTSSSSDASRASGSQGGGLYPLTLYHVPPPGPLFASLLNTRSRLETKGRSSFAGVHRPRDCCGAAQFSEDEQSPVTIGGMQAGTGCHDQTSRGDSVAQDQTSTLSSNTTSTASSVASTDAASATSDSVTTPDDRRPTGRSATALRFYDVPDDYSRARRSETVLKTYNVPLEGAPKDADLKGLPEEPKEGTSLMLPLIACALVLMVVLFLLPFILSNGHARTDQSTEASQSSSKWTIDSVPSRPAAGHVGSACNNSSSCLGEAVCLEDVCRCEGSDVNVIEGICVAVSTPETKQPRPIGETLPTAKRFTFVRTVRLATATSPVTAENASVMAGEDPVLNTTEVAADDNRRVAVVSNTTAQEEEAEELHKPRGRQQ
ncbi:hypothetical protein MTO96_008963 [Rhipicephalus appendiculatus]